MELLELLEFWARRHFSYVTGKKARIRNSTLKNLEKVEGHHTVNFYRIDPNLHFWWPSTTSTDPTDPILTDPIVAYYVRSCTFSITYVR